MTTAVLLPGNMCDARLWTEAVRDALAKRGLSVADADPSRDSSIAAMAERALRTEDDLIAIGFSMRTCLPWAMAARACSRWLGWGVATYTASTFGSATSASTESCTVAMPCFAANSAAFSG